MRHSAKIQRLLLLGLSGPIVALNIWLLYAAYHYFEHVVNVLVIAAIMAFLLNYPVSFFERARITRAQAVILVLLTTVTVLVILGVTLVPAVIDQMVQLLNGIPAGLETSQENLQRFDNWARAHRLPLAITGFTSQINGRIMLLVQTLAGQAVGFAVGTLTGFLDLVLVVVLAFYMQLYGARMWLGVINLLPSHIGIQALKQPSVLLK
jgi:predicted PurR-regulated permease PerM